MNNQAHIFFWNVPEILNNLVGFLDIASIIELSHVVPKAADLGRGHRRLHQAAYQGSNQTLVKGSSHSEANPGGLCGTH